MAFKLAEAVNLPVMVVLDAFYLSHTYEPIDISSQDQADNFLPQPSPRFRLDTDDPFNFGQLAQPGVYTEMRYNMELAMNEALDRYSAVTAEFSQHFGRSHQPVEALHCEDADIILITSGTVSATASITLSELRQRGERVGLLKMRMFRPFPVALIRRFLAGADRVAVVDRNFSFGAGGIFAQEIRAALCNHQPHPQVFGYIAGLGGRDITPQTIEDIYRKTQMATDPPVTAEWIDLNQEQIEQWYQ